MLPITGIRLTETCFDLFITGGAEARYGALSLNQGELARCSNPCLLAFIFPCRTVCPRPQPWQTHVASDDEILGASKLSPNAPRSALVPNWHLARWGCFLDPSGPSGGQPSHTAPGMHTPIDKKLRVFSASCPESRNIHGNIVDNSVYRRLSAHIDSPIYIPGEFDVILPASVSSAFKARGESG